MSKLRKIALTKIAENETDLAKKWYLNIIDESIENYFEAHPEENAQSVNKNELLSTVSTDVLNKINKELSALSEGFISDIIHQSYEKIDFNSIIENELNNRA